MLRNPIQYGNLKSARAKRRTCDIAHSLTAARKAQTNVADTTVLDEAFANFTGEAAAQPADWRTATREIIAEIAIQLDTLDSQRRQLARLLEAAEATNR